MSGPVTRRALAYWGLVDRDGGTPMGWANLIYVATASQPPKGIHRLARIERYQTRFGNTRPRSACVRVCPCLCVCVCVYVSVRVCLNGPCLGFPCGPPGRYLLSWLEQRAHLVTVPEEIRGIDSRCRSLEVPFGSALAARNHTPVGRLVVANPSPHVRNSNL